MQYLLTKQGYTLVTDDGTVLFSNQPEIALVVDMASGTLHKHGQVSYTQDWHKKAQSAFRANGFDWMADDLVCLSAAFKVEDLNKCLAQTGYAQALVSSLLVAAS